jgi:hypothetical protein
MTDPTAFPRLLVATEFPPNGAGGGPAVVRQMLRGWPVEKLFWWSCHREEDQRFGQAVSGHRVAMIPARLYPNRRLTSQKSWLLASFWVGFSAAHLKRTLQLFDPEIVWAIPHHWSIPALHRTLSRVGLRRHVSVHDYPDTANAVARHGLRVSARFSREVDQLYASATSRDAICQAMIEDLKFRTGVFGEINRAGLEAADLEFLSASVPSRTDSIRVAYAGTILVEPEFEFFATCLERVRSQLRRPLSLDFFGAHSYRDRRWFRSEWMREHGNLPEPALTQALRECTWGFSPMSLHNDDPRYNCFSLPTKFSSYMASGLPVLTLAHPQSSVAQMAATYRVGLLQTRRDEAEFCQRMESALSEPDARATYRSEILRCARTEFDAARMRRMLWRSLGVRGLEP